MKSNCEEKKICVVILLGAPGAGKGTLIRSLLETGWSLSYLSTGALCRKIAAQSSPLGKEVASLIASGQLISDEVTSKMVKQWFEEQATSNATLYIIDGFPRTLPQLMVLYDIVEKAGYSLTAVRLLIKENIAFCRMMGRVICSKTDCGMVFNVCENLASCTLCNTPLKRRSDDQNEEVMKVRLKTYKEQEEKLISLLEEKTTPLINIETTERDKKEITEEFSSFIFSSCPSFDQKSHDSN